MCVSRGCRNIFFICANLVQIVLILMDRRQVQLSEEEQRLYDLVFADVFSPQEFRKLTKSATPHSHTHHSSCTQHSPSLAHPTACFSTRRCVTERALDHA